MILADAGGAPERAVISIDIEATAVAKVDTPLAKRATAPNAAVIRVLLELPKPLSAYHIFLGMDSDIFFHLEASAAFGSPAPETTLVNHGHLAA